MRLTFVAAFLFSVALQCEAIRNRSEIFQIIKAHHRKPRMDSIATPATVIHMKDALEPRGMQRANVVPADSVAAILSHSPQSLASISGEQIDEIDVEETTIVPTTAANVLEASTEATTPLPEVAEEIEATDEDNSEEEEIANAGM